VEEQQTFTELVDRYMTGHLADLAADADDLLNLYDTAGGLIASLQDRSTLSTMGLVLRRQLAAQGLTQLDPHAPWSPSDVREAAQLLHELSLRRHGLNIPVREWTKYLTDDLRQGPHRERLLQLALVTVMDRASTARLLLSCDQSGYDLRDPLEFLCFYCQGQPGVYTWWDVEDLLSAFRQGQGEVPPAPTPAEDREPGLPMTQLLRQKARDLTRQALPQGEADRELVRFMALHREEFTGHSRSARARYLSLLRYLAPLYPFYDKGGLTRRPVPLRPDGSPVLKAQIQAALDARFTVLDDVAQRAGPRDVHTVDDRVYSEALGRIAIFCKNYYYRANQVVRGQEPVDRRDVLLLGYLLLSGVRERGTAGLAALAEKEPLLGPAIAAELLPDLEELSWTKDLQDQYLLIRRCLNTLLELFELRPALYTPAPFDRFVLLCSLGSVTGEVDPHG